MTLWEQSIQLHGHRCCVLALGYRAGIYAKELLAQSEDDQELVALVETADCSTDAIQAVLGATTGNRRLLVKEQGKHVFTISNQEKAVRIALKPDVLGSIGEEFLDLMTKVANGDATGEQSTKFYKMQDPLMEYILKAPADELFSIKYVPAIFVEPGHDFHIKICEKCQEGVAAGFAQNNHGNYLCQSCSDRS